MVVVQCQVEFVYRKEEGRADSQPASNETVLSELSEIVKFNSWENSNVTSGIVQAASAPRSGELFYCRSRRSAGPSALVLWQQGAEQRQEEEMYVCVYVALSGCKGEKEVPSNFPECVV